MKLHREGRQIIILTVALWVVLNLAARYFFQNLFVLLLVAIPSSVMLFLILNFFRDPKRNFVQDKDLVIAPADGKVVVIEETEETEFLKDRRIQISIFMSPLNVHINRTPIAGKVKYTKYHSGKYLVAWHPKSSTENERNTVVIENSNGAILVRQIAGAVARRIKNYIVEGQEMKQAEEFGFIRFGSRVDVFLPLDAEITVSLEEKVTGGQTILAKLVN